MAKELTFGASTADFVYDGSTGLAQPGVFLAVATSPGQGYRLSEGLYDVNGQPLSVLKSDAAGEFRFLADSTLPDGTSMPLLLWVAESTSAGVVAGSARWYAVTCTNLPLTIGATADALAALRNEYDTFVETIPNLDDLQNLQAVLDAQAGLVEKFATLQGTVDTLSKQVGAGGFVTQARLDDTLAGYVPLVNGKINPRLVFVMPGETVPPGNTDAVGLREIA